MEYFQKEKNIAKILGYSENPFCIVMKYYDRGSLANWIKTLNRFLIDVIAFGHDIASGI